MKIGTITAGSDVRTLSGELLANYPSGLDRAVAETLQTRTAIAYIGSLFTSGPIEAYELDTVDAFQVPATLKFQPEPGVTVAAIALYDPSGFCLYLSSDPSGGDHWVAVPRIGEFYAMATTDRDEQRKRWVDALLKVKQADWPAGLDLSKANMTNFSIPALRLLLAFLGPHVCPVTKVNQPSDKFVGGQTRGFTIPLLRYPVSEPDCYIHVISRREGLLESINAYDLNAGISLGSIQFNVHRSALFQFLHEFHRIDPDLFSSCFGQFGWSPVVVGSGSTKLLALDATDAKGNKVQLVARDADHGRNCGYFQSGIPGNASLNQVDASFRRTLASAFRDAVVWPHIQEVLMSVSSEWLRPGLQQIEAAGIGPVDALNPDRDTFVLKSLLLSAYVRYSACLGGLLKALKPYSSASAKLAAVKNVLLASDKWSSCDHGRRAKLAERLDAQRPDAFAAWDVINRLASSNHPPSLRASFSSGDDDLENDDYKDCDEHRHAGSHRHSLWSAQSVARNAQIGNVSERFEALLAQEVDRQLGSKKSRVTSKRSKGERKNGVEAGSIVFRSKRSGSPEIGIVHAIEEMALHVSGIDGMAGLWRAKVDAQGRLSGKLQTLSLSNRAQRALEALREELVVGDSSLAIPPFDEEVKKIVERPLLLIDRNAVAVSWNKQRHPATSGVELSRVSSALAPYVNFASVRDALRTEYGGLNANDDTVLIEAIHQFQKKTYVDPSQHDGRCGESTLDNLGLYLGRPGLNQVDVANPTAQAHLIKINKKLASGSDNPPPPTNLNAANWFRHMTAPAFLGETFRNGIHATLLRRLRAAERHLLTLPEYKRLTPVQLGRAVGILEFHRGSRPTATTASMHTFGLATDVNYTGNPWIEGANIVNVLRRARLLVSGLSLGAGAKAAAFLHSKLSTLSTEEIYDTLWELDRDFRTYLALRSDAEALVDLLEGHLQKGTPGIFDAAETVAKAKKRWSTLISADYVGLDEDDGFNDRDPANGFLNLSKDLVIALRDHGCLAWGASDFGPTACGDIMHFDCRNTGLGRIINQGFVPLERPCS
jgi:hypothetical protein